MLFKMSWNAYLLHFPFPPFEHFILQPFIFFFLQSFVQFPLHSFLHWALHSFVHCPLHLLTSCFLHAFLHVFCCLQHLFVASCFLQQVWLLLSFTSCAIVGVLTVIEMASSASIIQFLFILIPFFWCYCSLIILPCKDTLLFVLLYILFLLLTHFGLIPPFVMFVFHYFLFSQFTSISFCFHHILMSFLWPMSNTATKLCFFWKNIVIMFGVSEKSRTFALAFRKYFRMSTKRKSSLKFLHTDKVVQELRVWSVFQVRHAGYMTQSNDRGEYDNKRTFWQTKQFACFYKAGTSVDRSCFAVPGSSGGSEDIEDILQWRVWSWLRMNASYRLNTCKSRANIW